MPTFEITSPQGQKYRIDGPEGATEQQALQMLQRKLAGMPPPPQASPEQQDKPPSLGQEISGQFSSGASKAASAFNPLSPENRAITERGSKGGFFDPTSGLERGKLLASGVGGAMQMAGAPITGAVRSYGAPLIQSLDAPMRALTQTIFGKDAKVPDGLTHEQAADVAESLMSGLAPRGAAGGVRAVPGKSPAPALDEIFDSSNAHYEKLKEMNVPLRPDVQAKLGDTIKGNLEKDAFYKEDQPRTFRSLERLAEGEASSKKIYAVRTALGRVVTDLPGSSDALAAGKAIEHLDEYLSNVPGFAETSKAARQDWAAAKTSQMVQELEHKAQRAASASGSGANLDNATRQQVKSLLNNSKKVGRLSAEERAIAEQIVSGGKIGNVARLLSKLGPKHPLTGWGSAIAADFSGGSGAATASLGVGAIAQWLAEKMTTGKIRNLDEVIRSRSALAQSSPREKVISDAKMALRSGSFPKEAKEKIRMVARGVAPAAVMLSVKNLLEGQEPQKTKLPAPSYGGPQ